MNFVIFSYNFLPANDAEGFCGARFASALADAGHNVHVVTMDWPRSVDADLCKKLLHPDVKITVVPFASLKWRVFSNLRYLTRDRGAVNLSNCIRAVKKVLKEYDRPILISRGLPVLSSMVGWHCRRHARLWVSHFSDPFPMALKPAGFLARLFYEAERLWGRRCIRDASIVSLTCQEAERYFAEEYAEVWDRSKLCVLTHIGDPWLAAKTAYEKEDGDKIISHVGTLGRGRCLELLSEALDIVKSRCRNVEFIEAGLIKDKDVRLFTTSIRKKIFPGAVPSLTSSIVEASDVSIIIDLKSHLPYIPYLPSKFAYQLFTDVPIVAVTQQGSAMHRYCTACPDAGLYFADNSSPEAISSTIIRVLNSSHGTVNRGALRKEFSGSEVVRALMVKIGERA